jgi:hypothetical protein
VLSTTFANACGDKLSAFSRAAHNKDLVHSAQILLLAPARSAGAALAADPQFQSALKKGNHKLRVVDSVDQMAGELASGNFDLVLADAESLSKVEGLMRSSSSSAVLVPVMDAPSNSALRTLGRRYSAVLVPHSKSGHYLDVIDDAVEVRMQRAQPTRMARK